jgi:dihydrofolate reductase
MTVSIIAAISKNYAIGKDNRLIWHLPADLKLFKSLTTGHCIIMGRKNYESIGRPLPNRTNIIISRNKDLKVEGCISVNSLDNAIKLAKEKNETEAFIIGGGEIYKQALPVTDKMYISWIGEQFEADVFFPQINFSEWKLVKQENHGKDEKNKYDFRFCEYERIKKM